MKKLKAAFIGCGGRSWVHIQRLMEFEDVELAGFMDLIKTRAVEKRDRAGQGVVFEDYAEMLDSVKPDVLFVCVTPAEHGKIEYAAIDRGVHMMIEKPMAIDMKLAEDVCKKCADKNIIAAVAFQDRYLDLAEQCKEWMEGKQIGLVDGAWVGGIPGVPWWPKYSTSAGQIVEQNIHIFDMLRNLFGEAESVYCAAGRGIVKQEGYDLHDYSSAVIRMKSGVIATLYTGCYRTNEAAGFPNGLTIHAADCDIRYYLRNHVVYDSAAKSVTIMRRRDSETLMDRTFIDAVKSGGIGAVRSPYADALKTLRLTLACNESISTGLPVVL